MVVERSRLYGDEDLVLIDWRVLTSQADDGLMQSLCAHNPQMLISVISDVFLCS